MTFCVESMSIMCFGAVPRSRDSFHPGCRSSARLMFSLLKALRVRIDQLPDVMMLSSWKPWHVPHSVKWSPLLLASTAFSYR